MYYLIEFEDGVAVVPDCWLLQESATCYWPQGIGATQWSKMKKLPIPNHKDSPLYPYIKILKIGDYEKMKKAEAKSLHYTDFSSSCSEIKNDLKRKKLQTQWSPDIAIEKKKKKENSKIKNKQNSPINLSENFNYDSSDSEHLVPLLPPPPCRQSTSTTYTDRIDKPSLASPSTNIASSILPDLVKQAVADAVRPYFQSVFKQLEEIKLQLRVQRQKQVSLGHNTSGNLPENFIFPLKEIDELLELNRIFLENTECRSNAVIFLSLIGGSGLDDCLRKVAKKILTAKLSMLYNLTGRKEKLEFGCLMGVKNVIYGRQTYK
ncbi:uncharacterized protein LOC136088813 [Hydra vulgaris]|uniref:Uncharacterized protein LOC136088813 n=1 Tax=Hydra vulgaris TaxID=6087 RepID=A0ABM4D5X6_HYDVU